MEPRRLLAAVSWDGGAGDNLWHTAANWSNDQVPTGVDDVTIDVAGNPEILFTVAAAGRSVRSLVSEEAIMLTGGTLTIATTAVLHATLWINEGTAVFNGAATLSSGRMSSGMLGGSGEITVTGTMQWTGGGMVGTGATVVAPSGLLSISGEGRRLARQLRNNGEVSWSGGDIFPDGAVIVNNGLLSADIASTTVGGATSFVNRGTIIKRGSATLTIQSNGFDNTGVVDVQAGRLSFSGVGSHAATFAVAGTLNMTGGQVVANVTTFVGAGLLQTANGVTVHCPVSLAGSISASATVFHASVAIEGSLETAASNFHGPVSFGVRLQNLSGATVFHDELLPHAGTALVVSGGSVDLGSSSSTFSSGLLSGTLLGSGELRLLNAFTWSGGAMAGNGVTVVDTTTVLTLLGNTHELKRRLRNEGTTAWLAGDLRLSDGTFENVGTFAATSATALNFAGTTGQNTFLNSGLLTKEGAGELSFLQAAATEFTNTGVVDVRAGIFRLGLNGVQSGTFTVAGSIVLAGAQTFQAEALFVVSGSLELADGAAVTMHCPVSIGGSLTVSGGTNVFFGPVAFGGSLWCLAGTVSFNGSMTGGSGAALQLTGGTANFNTPMMFGQLTLSSGVLAGSAEVTAGGVFTWAGGTMSGTGTTVLAPNATMTIGTGTHNLQRHLRNEGTVSWTGGQLRMNAGRVTNNGVFTTSGSAVLECAGFGGSNSFINHGALIKQGPGMMRFAVFSTAVVFTNNGTVDVRQGMLSFGNNNPVTNYSGATSTLTGGAWKVASTTTLTLTGATIRTLAAGTTVTLAGPASTFAAIDALTTNSGAFILEGGRLFHAVIGGGVFTNSGLLSLGRSLMTVDGNFVQTASGVLSFTITGVADHGKLAVTGTAQLDGTLVVDYDGYTLARGDAFELMSAASVSGTFASALLGGIQNLEIARLAYGPGGVVLEVFAAGDFDGDGFVTGEDYDLFVQAFEAGDFAVDMDGDGFITGVDFDLFVAAFELG